MTKCSNACQSFKTTAKALKRLGIICHFMYISEKIAYVWVGGPDFREGQVEIWAKKGNISFFQGFQREYVQIVPKWLGALDYIFFGQKFPSAIRI